MLGIVTCFFNPCGYRRNLENYFRFRDALGHDVTTVELSFNGEFAISDAIHIAGGPEHVMWQKERLLNIGINALPPQYNNVAWIDADLIFMNRHWVEQAEELLETYRAVQLCERLHQTDFAGCLTSSTELFGKAHQEKRLHEKWFPPGGAWVARREVLQQNGLFDADIIGGADSFTAFAWANDLERAIQHTQAVNSDSALKFYRQHAERLAGQVNGSIGYVPGDAIHLWHGERDNRRYVERREILKAHNFDPESDIAIDSNGLWRWNSHKPDMHRDVANYFALRNEDKTAAQIAEETQPTARHVTSWAVGVTTAPRNPSTLNQTLQSLSAAGFDDPHIFAEPETEIPESFASLQTSRRPRRMGAFPNWYLALTELVLTQPHADAYLLCQDDVLFADGLRDYLEHTLWPDKQLGVVSVYCPSHYAIDQPPGFVREDRGWKAWGALAYIFPNRSARQLLSDPRVLNHRGFGPASGLRNVDSVVGLWCEQAGLPYYVHTPSLAQHIGDASTIWKNATNTGGRRARDFQTHITAD